MALIFIAGAAAGAVLYRGAKRIDSVFVKSTKKHDKAVGRNNKDVVEQLERISSLGGAGQQKLTVKVLVRPLTTSEDIGEVVQTMLEFTETVFPRVERARTHFGLVFYNKDDGQFVFAVDLHKDGLRLEMNNANIVAPVFHPAKEYGEVTLKQVVDFLDSVKDKGYNLASWNCKHSLCYTFWRFTLGKKVKPVSVINKKCMEFCNNLANQYFDGQDV